MATEVCFITGATCGIGAEIAKAPLVDCNRVVATGRKPKAVTKALRAGREQGRAVSVRHRHRFVEGQGMTCR